MAGAEAERLAEDARREQNWKRWGPYLAERQWGTVREDYSPDGDVLGLLLRTTTRAAAPTAGARTACSASPTAQGRLCFALALWNGRDPDPQGAALRPHRPRGEPRRGREGALLLPRLHADPLLPARRSTSTRRPSSPTRGWSRRTAQRGKAEPEFELVDTGVFDDDRYFDVFAEYAKADARRHPDPHHRRQPRARGRDAAPAADALVPQHLVLGARGRGLLAQAAHPPERTGAHASREHAGLGRYRLDADARRPAPRRRAALHRERDQPRAALRRAQSRSRT